MDDVCYQKNIPFKIQNIFIKFKCKFVVCFILENIVDSKYFLNIAMLRFILKLQIKDCVLITYSINLYFILCL